MTAFIPKRYKSGWIVQKDVPGPMPAKLTGMFTEEKRAKTAIELYLAEIENKRTKNLPPKQRAKYEAVKAEQKAQESKEA